MRARIGFLLGLLLCGCLSAENLTRRTVPAALDEGVGFFENPESQRRIERLMLDPQVQHAARELSKTLVDGVVESMTDDARQAELRQASARYIEAVSAAAARSLRSDLGPAAAEAARSAVQQVLGAGLSPETRQDMRALAQSLTQSTVDGLMESAGRGLRHQVGPALRAVIEDELGPSLRTMIARDVAPGLRRALADELTPAFGLVAREVTHQIIIGGHDGLEELRFRERADAFQADFWTRLEALLHRGMQLSTIIAWALGVVVLVLAILFGRAILLRRRLDEERLRSERMLLGVMQGLQQGSDKPDIEAFLAHLHERNPDLADDAFMSELARRVSQPGGRVGRPRRRL
ncbi:hypothetical protein SAMN02745121_05773 [Nannocystis exedens]|uniref:Uncharacterized protein n=1 Tax=Nannocystis exedens TaxID=54 RepID=A0A1I2DWY3_9BACT|nr:hypothetical protein [Nannocystis exedens]PCC69125.1 hypothetical protein NAEX_02147 [Nannocystis exedens]SFE85135.1 hypothetical protein SAMN02745121_05773 [Nannocystis exedens]